MEATHLTVISDACLRYGSPQIPAMARLIADRFACKITVIEPSVRDFSRGNDMFPGIDIRPVATERHVYEEGGRAEYLDRAAAMIDVQKPDMLIVVCTFTLPVLLKIRFRPRVVIYFAIESIIQYGIPDSVLHHAVRDSIDYVVFPEENRARLDGYRCGLLDKPFSVILNSYGRLPGNGDILAPDQRNGRIIHQGTIGVNHTYSDYFLDRRIQRLPIDIYGPLVDDTSNRLRSVAPDTKKLNHRFTAYRGRLDILRLAAVRKHYLYSICIWNPSQERGLYAPSNKFFEAISSGVPPLTAPHPQHVRLIREFDCGILLNGWSFNDFRLGLLFALRIARTERYAELVANCIVAARSKLNGSRQLQPVVDAVIRIYAER